ncbi:MAG: N-acetylmuramoyl-L-alanine amidase, partial [Planctomycetes bacterium]|nr:N-acetylmuramoyl-L-alanine amidase [Planctomycetota bacterium]
ATAEVLYGPTPPSANEESFARYLRAEAYNQKGTPELGIFDRDRARLLALDPELRRRLPEPVAAPAEAPHGAPSAVKILARSAWDAKAADRSNLEPMVRPSRLTIHHSAMYFRDTRPASCKAQLQMIQREHMGNRGYGDIGYHYLIDPSGRVWEGREMRWQGAHASGDNNIANIGVCLLGNFMRGRSGQGPTPAQVTSMQQLVVSLMARYRFGADAIHCHSDFKATECPGPLLESVVTQLARDLQKRGNAPVATNARIAP